MQEGPDLFDIASGNSNNLLQIEENLHELQSEVQIVPLACNDTINSQLAGCKRGRTSMLTTLHWQGEGPFSELGGYTALRRTLLTLTQI